MTPEQSHDLTRSVLRVLDNANPMYPLFLGHPLTGEPVEMSKETYEHIRRTLRATLPETATS